MSQANDIQGKLWPAAANHSYTVIERLGRTTLGLFENSASSNDRIGSYNNFENHFGEIDQE